MFTDAEWFTAELKLVVSSMFQVQIHHQHRKRHFMLTQGWKSHTCLGTLKLSLSADRKRKKAALTATGKLQGTRQNQIFEGESLGGANSSFELDRHRSLSKTITSLSSLSPEMFYFGFTNITAASSRPRGCSSYCMTPARVMEVWQRGKYKGRRKDWRPGQPVKGAEV